MSIIGLSEVMSFMWNTGFGNARAFSFTLLLSCSHIAKNAPTDKVEALMVSLLFDVKLKGLSYNFTNYTVSRYFIIQETKCVVTSVFLLCQGSAIPIGQHWDVFQRNLPWLEWLFELWEAESISNQLFPDLY
jgi:hypothetical protein